MVGFLVTLPCLGAVVGNETQVGILAEFGSSAGGIQEIVAVLLGDSPREDRMCLQDRVGIGLHAGVAEDQHLAVLHQDSYNFLLRDGEESAIRHIR